MKKPARFRLSPVAVRPHRWLGLLPLLVTAPLPLPAAETAAAAANFDSELESKSGGFGFSLLPKAFQKNPKVDLNVITEMTPDGRKLTPPTAAKPVYYVTIPGGFVKSGQSLSAGEKPPPVADLERVMQKALTQNSYLPADGPQHSPSLALIYHWGSHGNQAEDPQQTADQMRQESETGVGPNRDNLTSLSEGQLQFALTNLAKRKDLLERAALIGGTKFAADLQKVLEDQVVYQNEIYRVERPAPQGMSMLGGGSESGTSSGSSSSGGSTPMPKPIMGDMPTLTVDTFSPFERFRRSHPQVEHLVEESFGTCYFVIASAYDYTDLSQGRRRLLWRTKMTVNAEGVAMQQTLPTLVISAGKYFGREMDGAATISRRLLKGEVEVGTPTVVEYSSATTPPKKPEPKR